MVRRYGPKRALNLIQESVNNFKEEVNNLSEIGHSTSVKGTDLEKKMSEIAVRMLDLIEELEFEAARCTPDIAGLNYKTESDILS